MNERVEHVGKSELLDHIRSERELLEAILAQLNENHMVQPGVEGEWSVKDILAHIATWERWMIQWVGETLRGEVPELPETWDYVHKLNEQTYLENRDRPLVEVLADFRHFYQKALKAVEAISEEDLVDPDRFKWRDGVPLWRTVAANTWWHYKMHRESIQIWLEDLKSA